MAPGRPWRPGGPGLIAGSPGSPIWPFSPASPFIPSGPMKSNTDGHQRREKQSRRHTFTSVNNVVFKNCVSMWICSILSMFIDVCHINSAV